ncbi:ATP-dependent zinc protease family protein [Marinobacterium weihaiense]|uniref:ATP-dependent zinc protease n=1 Tax=Marinobacterium weihaiense TaxID=2851016 RepID=A0ABS6MED2_9GAMM|nr:ATP-dependent zinc protease [Marinobacterium weihaiense]MBV0934681.1 ATP-dependent zinc protease [Marinobacterium weihaiense]
MYTRLTSGLRLMTLLLLATLTTACSHDRYLFLERAQLDNLNQQLSQQQSRLETLTAVSQQQFDSLSRSQQFQRQELLNALRDQNAKLDKLYLPPPRPLQATTTNTGPGAPGRYQGKLVVGEVERLYLAVPGITYNARIDSGATTSSLHATNIQRFERDGEDWVRFDIRDPESNTPVTIERKLARNANIIQASSEDPERRPVVELPFVIGSHRQSAEFTLSDRSQLTYPVLIGRNVLRDVMLIDVGREYVTELPDTLTRPAATGDDQ